MDFIEVEVFGVPLRYYDDERIEKISRGKWKPMKQSNCYGYKLIRIKNGKKVQVHRVVYKANNLSWNVEDTSKNNLIDHIDTCRSNNKISNLQVATAQQNAFNTNAKGFCFHKATNKYRARIKLDGKSIHLGCFDTEAEERNTYIKAKAIYHKF